MSFRHIGAYAFEKWASQKLPTNEQMSEKKPIALPLVESLTKREVEILQALASDLSNKEIALNFELTEGTVKNHLFNLYGKLGINKRIQSILVAREHGIIK